MTGFISTSITLSLNYNQYSATAYFPVHRCTRTRILQPRHGQRRKHNSTADHTENTSHVIAKHYWDVTSLRMRKLHRHKENTAVVLCDVTAYAEVCLPSRCLETGCIIPFYCCVRVLLSNGCFCGSTVLAWSKYATVLLR
jgi:hypothetical protein